MLSGRPLWLLDEPFAALDSDGEALMARAMARHCEGGGIVIAATHGKLGLGNASIRL
jgi:heme exporter protein A